MLTESMIHPTSLNVVKIINGWDDMSNIMDVPSNWDVPEMMSLKRTIMALLATMALILVPLSCSGESEGAVNQTYAVYDGGVYEFTTRGTGTVESPYECTLRGYTVGESDCVFVQSALDGYPVETIASGAFTGSSLRNVVLPDSVKTIESEAFTAASLEGIYFLGDRPVMESDSFPDGVTLYVLPEASGWDVPTGWSHGFIETVVHTSSDGSRVNVASLPGEVAVYDGTPSADGGLTVPSTVTMSSGDVQVDSIAQKSFYSRKDVKDVTVGDGVWIIRDRAFYNPDYEDGDNLRSATLPDSVRVVMDEAFRQQHNLGNINLRNVEYLGFEALRMCYAMTDIDVSSVTDLKAGSLYVCKGVKSVKFNPGLKAIPDRLMGYCHSLESLEIPSGVETIGIQAFYEAESLTSLTIPDSVRSISGSCFFESKLLKSIDLGDSLEHMGADVFNGCTSLESIVLPDSLRTVGDNAFRGCSSLVDIDFGDGIQVTGEHMFTNCRSLESVVIPGTVKTIADATFKACASLRDVTVSDGVQVVGEEAFMMCESLVDVRLPASVRTVSDEAFKGCTSLVTVSLGAGLQEVGDDLFKGCTSLTDVYLDGSTPDMEDDSIPAGVTVNPGSNPVPPPLPDSDHGPGNDSDDDSMMMVAGVIAIVVVVALVAFVLMRRNH